MVASFKKEDNIAAIPAGIRAKAFPASSPLISKS